MPHVLHTALNGTLEGRPEGWYWRSGQREPRVRDLDPAAHFGLVTSGPATDVGWIHVPPRLAASDPSLLWVWQAWCDERYDTGENPPDKKPSIRVPLADWISWWGSNVIGPAWDPADDVVVRRRAADELST